jgi:hypothetical protein
MSIVTGQYYLHAISRQFEQIEKQPQQLIRLHHNEKVAVLRAAAAHLESLFASRAVTCQDELTRLQGKAAEIEQEYRQLLAAIDADRYERIAEGVLSKRAIDNLEREIALENPDEYCQMVLFAAQIGLACRLLDLRMNAALVYQGADAAHKIADSARELVRYQISWKENEAPRKADEILSRLKCVAYKIANSAYLGSSVGRAEEFKRGIADQREHFQAEANRLDSAIGSAAGFITEKLTEPLELVLTASEEGVFLVPGDYCPAG